MMTTAMKDAIRKDAYTVKNGLEDILRDVQFRDFRASDVNWRNGTYPYEGSQVMALVNRGVVEIVGKESSLTEISRTKDRKGRTIVTSVECERNIYRIVKTYEEWKRDMIAEFTAMIAQ